MATLTIKIDSDDLAREILTHLGYLPEDDVPDLVEDEEDNGPLIEALKSWSIKPEEKEAPRLPKTEVEEIHERMKAPLLFPKPTRKMSEEPKQNVFCTVLEPSEEVEPVDNELGTPLDVYSDETKKERDELYKQSREVRIPPPEERLKTQIDRLEGDERLDYLDMMADHDDKAMRDAVKDYVFEHYTGHNLKSWPALQKILDMDTNKYELYKQSLEAVKAFLNPETEPIVGEELVNHLNAFMDYSHDLAMRAAVKDKIIKEYQVRHLKLWPALEKILDNRNA